MPYTSKVEVDQIRHKFFTMSVNLPDAVHMSWTDLLEVKTECRVLSDDGEGFVNYYILVEYNNVEEDYHYYVTKESRFDAYLDEDYGRNVGVMESYGGKSELLKSDSNFKDLLLFADTMMNEIRIPKFLKRELVEGEEAE